MESQEAVTRAAAIKLQKELTQLSKGESPSFSVGLWNVTLLGPVDSYYEGGMFKAVLKFPYDYPYEPPTMRFTKELFHPNIYHDGRVCISILHKPGEDPNGYERPEERWSPVQTVETILVSIISMLSEPNPDSPANVDAAKLWREDRKAYRKEVRRCVEKSLEW
ncbi:Ubiquitin-conjugating enzyme E2 14 [Coemansia sp. RSA 1200]|nr:Ubiquitin-conjugating enzyme E2 14 [Coemansia sp. RSA 1200]